ncbi:unnamed protein product [Owenia fusiformis]|uniref:peptidylprolyl isomerase n=1 Tax=Owenia fusiformis TaxID=6347 RepID=A0A8J1TYF8_OWEFU|nr:unnamed protein product [Owenia fusiformis]
MTEPARPWTDDDLIGEKVGKKEMIIWLQENATGAFLLEHKLKGAVKNVNKSKTKDALIEDYNALYETKSFKKEGEEEEEMKKVVEKTESLDIKDASTEAAAKDDGVIHFKKRTIKKGNKKDFPKKGDQVLVYYTGKLADGTVFDSNTQVKPGRKGKMKAQPLKFKLGVGLVIRGWDEGIKTMSIGEKAELEIEPVWAYGKRGLEASKIPGNATLTFEVELIGIE